MTISPHTLGSRKFTFLQVDTHPKTKNPEENQKCYIWLEISGMSGKKFPIDSQEKEYSRENKAVKT